MISGVTAVIPAHTPRLADGSLLRAVESVLAQEEPVDAIVIAVDADGRGAAATRQRALAAAQTEWVAFCDADDVWYPQHTATLLRLAAERRAEYVYSWFDGNSPFPGHRGRQMDPAQPHHTTMTVMVRTDLAQDVGFAPHPDAHPDWPGEDWRFTLGCLERGARFAGTGDVTWHYGVDGHNTSGLASRWTPSRPQADITVIVPHIPTRRAELLDTLRSVCDQELLPASIAVAVDNVRQGSAATRNRALTMATSTWAAPLDDDDLALPEHLRVLHDAASASGDVDVVYSGCTVHGPDGQPVPDRPEWGRFGQDFDPALLRRESWLPVTSLYRAQLGRDVGGYRCLPGLAYDDWGFWVAMLGAGARFLHVPAKTWIWRHHGANTSGQPDRW